MLQFSLAGSKLSGKIGTYVIFVDFTVLGFGNPSFHNTFCSAQIHSLLIINIEVLNQLSKNFEVQDDATHAHSDFQDLCFC